MRRGPRATRANSPGRSTALFPRLHALFVTALVLCSFGARLGELTLVRHAMCVHGDLVHAESARSGKAAPVVRSVDGPAAETGGSTAIADHDHCDVRAARFDAAAEAVPVSAPVALLTFLVWPGRALDATAPVGVLALAPKTPPPAV